MGATEPVRSLSSSSEFEEFGEVLAGLYSMALNGVVCDPSSTSCCAACREVWDRALDLLERHDPDWGSIYREGPMFQPVKPDEVIPG